jgi:hypothetical protein
MKKVFITLLVISFVFSSCKENNKKEVSNEDKEIKNEVKKELNNLGDEIKEGYQDVTESIASTFNDIEIPELEDEKAEAHLESYANYVKNQLNKGIDNIENSEFVKETKEFSKKSETFLKNLGSDAKVSFKETLYKIDAKVSEIEKDLES